MNFDSPRHRPNKFEKYRNAHDSYIENFLAEGFIGSHTLEFGFSPYEISLKGEMSCLGQILINVEKDIEIISGTGDSALVQTAVYIYNVSVRSYGNVFRYDNSHPRIGHPDNHHKHDFDWKLNEVGEGRVTWIGQDWPTLGQVIEETRDWYWMNKDELPEGYSTVGLR